MSQSDSYAVAHLLISNGIGHKTALSAIGCIDRIAETLKGRDRGFLQPQSERYFDALTKAWIRVVNDGRKVHAIASEDLRLMNPKDGYALFAMAEGRTFQNTLDDAVKNPDVRTLCETVWGPTGSEMRDELGQRLMHAVRTSLGDKSPEAPIGWVLGSNSFARVICRNVKHAVYVYAAHVLQKDIEGAERFKLLVDELYHALPIAYGSFQGSIGPIFMVGNRQS